MLKGLVIKSTGKWYEVRGNDHKTYQCQVRGKIRLEGRSTTNPVAAGDIVDFDIENESEGNITHIHQRYTHECGSRQHRRRMGWRCCFS